LTSARRQKILYFTVVPLTAPSGGSMVIREHIERLASDNEIELTVCTINRGDEDSAYLAALDIKYYTIDCNTTLNEYRNLFLEIFDFSRRWPFPFENIRSPINDYEFSQLTEEINPDVIIIDYLFSAIFVPSVYFGNRRVITITLNREADFFRQQCKLHSDYASDASKSKIAQWRLSRFERAIYKHSDAIVALTHNDLATIRTTKNTIATVIQPVLDESTRRWQYKGSLEIFYVGNLTHYPNFLAMKWLAEEFAPVLETNLPAAKLNIIGLDEKDVKPKWRCQNINFLGLCDKETVTNKFLTCGLFIVPIENNFGSKIKVLECISHGTPLIATKTALSGIPFSSTIPQFELAHPHDAVKLAADILLSKEKVVDLSEEITRTCQFVLDESETQWGNLILQLSNKPKIANAKAMLGSPLYNHFKSQSPYENWQKKYEICTTQRDEVLCSGMYPLEMINNTHLLRWLPSLNKRFARWTSSESEIKIKLNPESLPKHLHLKFVKFDYHEEALFSLLANGEEIIHQGDANQELEFHVQLPDLINSEELHLNIRTKTIRKFPGDNRELGLLINSLTLDR